MPNTSSSHFDFKPQCTSRDDALMWADPHDPFPLHFGMHAREMRMYEFVVEFDDVVSVYEGER